MITDHQPEQAISTTLGRYCRTFDDARFDAFAALFEHGRWFMVEESGPHPVLDWIQRHIVLYDGSPLTRHETSGLVVDRRGDADEAGFRCGIVISQQLPDQDERLLARARFSGTFRRRDDGWWWYQHTMHSDQTNDLSSHIRGGAA